MGANEREQETIYGDGFHDGWDRGREIMVVEHRSAPLTRSDWWLWVAAVLGFVLGLAA